MTEYRRAHVPGGTWFFTVNLAERKGNRLLVSHIDALGWAFRYLRERHPFRLAAVVVLPDHLHCIWTLPSGDSDFSMRWNVLKGHFSRAIDEGERCASFLSTSYADYYSFRLGGVRRVSPSGRRYAASLG